MINIGRRNKVFDLTIGSGSDPNLLIDFRTSTSTSDTSTIVLFASGNESRVGIGFEPTEKVTKAFEVKTSKDSAEGTEIALEGSRTREGAQVGDEAGKINFVINSGSFNDKFSSGSIANIKTKVKAVNETGVSGRLVMGVSKDTNAEPIDLWTIGYDDGTTGGVLPSLLGMVNVFSGSIQLTDFTSGQESSYSLTDSDATITYAVQNRNNTQGKADLYLTGDITGSNVKVNGDITVTGTVDGVDVATLKSDFDTLEGKTLVSGSSQIDLGSASGTVDISSQTNLAGGTNLTLSGDTMNLDTNISLTSITASSDISASGLITALSSSIDHVLVNDKLQGNGSGFQFFAFNEDTVKVKFANWYSSNDRQYGMGQLWYETWFAAIDNQAGRDNRRIGFYLEEPNSGSSDADGGSGGHPTNSRFYVDINGGYLSGSFNADSIEFNTGSATISLPQSPNNSAGNPLEISSGQGNGANASGGNLTLRGGQGSGAGNGGNVIIRGGAGLTSGSFQVYASNFNVESNGNVEVNGTLDMNDNDINNVDNMTIAGAITASAFSGSELRIAENGTGLRMTNVGAFENSSGDFNIFATSTNLKFSTNGSSNERLRINSSGISGSVPFSGSFVGDGSNLTNITVAASDITGLVDISSQTNLAAGSGIDLTGDTISADVTSVAGQTGAVTLTADDISDTGTTNKFTTQANLTKLSNLNISGSSNFTDNEFLVADGTHGVVSTDALAVDSSGNLGIGISTPEVRLHMRGESAQTAQFLMEQYNDTADAPDIRTRRFRGTPTSPADVQTGDYLFRINVEGRDGGSNVTYGSMQFDVDGTDQDALNWKIQTRDTGGTLADRITIDSAGDTIVAGEVSSNTIKNIETTLASDSATNVDTFATATYKGAIYDYVLYDAAVGARTGQFMVIQDNSNIEFTDTSTPTLGTETSIPSITADISGANVRVRVTNGNGYTFKAFVKKL